MLWEELILSWIDGEGPKSGLQGLTRPPFGCMGRVKTLPDYMNEKIIVLLRPSVHKFVKFSKPIDFWSKQNKEKVLILDVAALWHERCMNTCQCLVASLDIWQLDASSRLVNISLTLPSWCFDSVNNISYTPSTSNVNIGKLLEMWDILESRRLPSVHAAVIFKLQPERVEWQPCQCEMSRSRE